MNRDRFTSGSTFRLVVTGLVCWALAGTAYAVLRQTYGDRPVSVDVRWAATVDDAVRVQLEQRYRLARPEPNGDRTFSYALTDRSRENIRNLVVDPAVEARFPHRLGRHKTPPTRSTGKIVVLFEHDVTGRTRAPVAKPMGGN